MPAGSAPKDRTFQPNAENEVPGQAMNDVSADTDDPTAKTSALDTLGGTDSGAVHTGLGHPGQGTR